MNIRVPSSLLIAMLTFGISTQTFAETTCEAKKICEYNQLRSFLPNAPSELGSSTALQAEEYRNMPQQAGSNFSTALKLEYNSNANKYSLPALKVTNTFDLVPNPEEAKLMYKEVLDAGFNALPAFTSPDNAQDWYIATQDDEHFYYAVWGNPLFSSIFGDGTSTLFVCRKKKDASLVWVKCVKKFLLTENEPNFLGSPNVLARVSLAIHKDRLYTTTMLTGAGPQLIALNKADGSHIWTMAYEPPEALSQDYFVTPETPLHSLTNQVPSITIGDLNISVAELAPNKVSIFVGISSFQNAVNVGSFFGFPTYDDQGALIRIDDLGATAEKVWTANTCAQKLHIGDTITNADPNDVVYNPFRPGSSEVLIFRDSTANGKFDYGTVLDYNGANPGYIPVGYPAINNNTMPIIANVFVTGGAAPLTESSLQKVWRSPAPGIGASSSIYTTIPGTPGPVTVTGLLSSLNTVQSSLDPGATVKFVIWAYLNQTQVNNVDAANWGVENQGVRYIAALPNGYTITNDQEARALNYYGNSVWAQAPVIDMKRNLVYFGTGQTHDMPIDEVLFYQNPQIAYLSRKQPVIDTEYEYARIDDSTINAPFSTLAEVNAAKKRFIDDTLDLSITFNDRSPRGNRSYCDAIMGVDLTTGEIQFGFRSIPFDAATFITDDPQLFVIKQDGFIIDGDMSSGIMYFDNIEVENASYATYLAGMNKASCFAMLDISGYNPNVPYNHQNLLEKGIVPYMLYAGPDGALGGSNYGHGQDGGSQVIFGGANAAAFQGSYSTKYNTGYNLGYEFHVTQDGRVFPIQASYISSVDVARKQIAWETLLGQRSHPNTNVYNGVMYTSRGDGVLFGLDTKTGKVIWKMDGYGEYGLQGISPPSFSQGKAVWIDNFSAAGGVVGGGGKTGLQLAVDEALLLDQCDSVKSLTANTTFVSYDVLPMAPGETVFDVLVPDEKVVHYWDDEGVLLAKHTNLQTGAITTIRLQASGYIDSSQQIVFSTNLAQNGIRYLTLSFFNRNEYILRYQELQGCTWVNKEATLKRR